MKELIRKKILITTLLILILIVSYNLFCLANSEYPTQPITIIVPYNPGGGSDTLARTIQPYLQEALGAPTVIVENKAGGATLLGQAEFLRREADGYTIFIAGPDGMILNKLLFPDEAAEITEFAPLVGVQSDARLFFVRKDSPYNTVEDLIKDIRNRPGEISLAMTTGSSGQWLAMWFKKKLNLPVNLVGFSGGGPATTALIGGHVDCYEDAGSGRVPFKDKIKAIGAVYPERVSIWPDAIPVLELDLFKEEGIDFVPGLATAANRALWVRREVKENYPERFYRLVSALYEVAKNPEFIKIATELGIADTLVWWPPSKLDEITAIATEVMKADPELIKMLKE